MKLLDILFESKKTEEQSINFLKKNNVNDAEGIVNMFVSKDKSNNQKNTPVMSYLYFISNRDSNTVDVNTISDVVNEYDDLYIKNRIKPIQITKSGLVIGDKVFNDFIKFSEYIHGLTSSHTKPVTYTSSESTTQPSKTPMWSGNDIDIYKGDSVGKCIEYTQSGLTDRTYSFCIGQPGNTMYKSYRDIKESTFYFIIDRNRKNDDGSINLNDPLHIVVFDKTNRGIELTDASNSTGTISEYGKDVNAYVDYLKSKGVPVDSLVNKQKTEQEKTEDELLGRRNEDLSWFINLDNPKNPNYKKPVLEPGQTELNHYKSAYIGRGHKLSDEQFDFLISAKSDDLLSQYVNTGLQLPIYQIEKLSTQHRKSYFRIRMKLRLSRDEFNVMTTEEKETYLKIHDDNMYNIIQDLLSSVRLLMKDAADNQENAQDKMVTDLLSLNTVIEYLRKISTSDKYSFHGLVTLFITKTFDPEKVKNMLGDLWGVHIGLIDGWGQIESQVSYSSVPEKVIKVYGKIAEDYIKNLDEEGVRRMIYGHNYDKMIKILLGFGISKKTINDALTYLNKRYEFKYELLPNDNSTNLQENIQRIRKIIGHIY